MPTWIHPVNNRNDEENHCCVGKYNEVPPKILEDVNAKWTTGLQDKT